MDRQRQDQCKNESELQRMDCSRRWAIEVVTNLNISVGLLLGQPRDYYVLCSIKASKELHYTERGHSGRPEDQPPKKDSEPLKAVDRVGSHKKDAKPAACQDNAAIRTVLFQGLKRVRGRGHIRKQNRAQEEHPSAAHGLGSMVNTGGRVHPDEKVPSKESKPDYRTGRTRSAKW